MEHNPTSPEQNLLDQREEYGSTYTTPIVNETDPMIVNGEILDLSTSKDNILALEESLPEDPPVVIHTHPSPLSKLRLLCMTSFVFIIVCTTLC